LEKSSDHASVWIKLTDPVRRLRRVGAAPTCGGAAALSASPHPVLLDLGVEAAARKAHASLETRIMVPAFAHVLISS
jgi:NAD dependent epimerase/dehydratase family enzyme